jgi:glycosyltransferase involved in cell wall biosynthesis
MAGQGNNRVLAIATPSLGRLSETFIRAQIEALNPGLVLHGGFLPTRAGELSVQECAGLPADTPVRDALVGCLKKLDIRCVLAQFGPTGAEMLEACREAGIELLIHFHGYDASRTDVLNHYQDKYRLMFAYAKRIFVVSLEMEQDLIRLGCPPDKLLYNPYGVSDRFYAVIPQSDSRTFCFIGRFVEKKGPVLLVRAFQKVCQNYPLVKLVMAGEGPLLKACRDLAIQFNLTGNIFFPGSLSHEMVPALMQKAFAYVQHSVTSADGDKEGTPVAILEASAASLPIVATRHAGIPDAVEDQVTGLLVEEGDVDAMCNAMLRLLENRSFAATLGLEGRSKMRREFSMDKYITRISASIDSTVS